MAVPLQPIPVQHATWSRVLDPPRKHHIYIFPGGRMSSKTFHASDKTVIAANTPYIGNSGTQEPGNIAVSRYIQKNIRHSLKPNIEKSIKRLNMSHNFTWDQTNKEFNTDASNNIIPKGIWNALDDFRGLDNFWWWWAEEAQYYPLDVILEIFDTMARFNDWCAVLTGNIISEDTPFYKWGKEQWEKGNPDVYFEIINYEKAWKFLTPGAKKHIAMVRAFDPDRYEHEFRGKPLQTMEGQVFSRGTHWEEDNMDAVVERLGLIPRYAIDHGGIGGEGGSGASPTVAVKFYVWEDNIYIQKTRHCYGIADRHIPALLAGYDWCGDSKSGAKRWEMPPETQYGEDILFDGVMDASEVGLRRIWSDHQQAQINAMKSAGHDVRPAAKPAGCELKRVIHIRNNYLTRINYETVKETEKRKDAVRECEQAFIDWPRYMFLPVKGEPGVYDKTKFKKGYDHTPDAVAYGMSDIIFPEDASAPQSSGFVYSF